MHRGFHRSGRTLATSLRDRSSLTEVDSRKRQRNEPYPNHRILHPSLISKAAPPSSLCRERMTEKRLSYSNARRRPLFFFIPRSVLGKDRRL